MSADRAACRAALVTLLDTITTFAEVYDGAPFTTGGVSPFATVTSDGTGDGPDKNLVSTNDEHYLLIDIFWLRKSTTEADLDALSKSVRDLVRANRGANATWSSLELNGRSQLDYAIIDGKDYRFERIPVVIW